MGHRSRILHASFNCDCLPTTTQSPLRRSALPRAPHGRWATRAGRSPGSRLERLLRPSRGRDVRRQWHVWRRLAAYSCGGSRGIRANGPSPRSLFTHPLVHGWEPTRCLMQAGGGAVSQSQSGCPRLGRARLWPGHHIASTSVAPIGAQGTRICRTVAPSASLSNPSLMSLKPMRSLIRRSTGKRPC